MYHLQGKCITLSTFQTLRVSAFETISWNKANLIEKGERATFKTVKEFNVLKYLYSKASHSMYAFAGLKTNKSASNLYR